MAQHNLANSYIGGEGVAQDYGAAVKWLRRASEAGFKPARPHRSGTMYLAKRIITP